MEGIYYGFTITNVVWIINGAGIQDNYLLIHYHYVDLLYIFTMRITIIIEWLFIIK